MSRTNNKDVVFITASLTRLGINPFDISALRRISRTLHRWGELECGDGNEYGSWAIERDDETDKPYFVRHTWKWNPNCQDSITRTPIADREAGALKRLAAIMASHKRLVSYHQTDPRGCALYIVRRRDITRRPDDRTKADGKLESFNSALSSQYTHGVAVY